MIEQNSELKRTANVVGAAEIAKKAAISSHAWDEDANYIVSCTNNGHIIVSSLAKAEVTQKFHFAKEDFNGLKLFRGGLVVSTVNSAFYFFRVVVTGKASKFVLVTKWCPKIQTIPQN
jgi:hypothetical protein